MIDPDDKENVAYNYSFPKSKVSYKTEVIDDDLGCVTLSESEDEQCPEIGTTHFHGRYTVKVESVSFSQKVYSEQIKHITTSHNYH